MSIVEAKKILRREARALRIALAASAPKASEAMAENFLREVPIASGATIAGYIAAHGEADPLPLMERLRAKGHPIALARVEGKALPLTFRLWREGMAPVAGAFGLSEAAPDWTEVRPEIVLVPLLGFDRLGHRLGYGGGFYDRTLRALRAHGTVLAAGIAFAGQEMILPHDANDEALDWIVTEAYAREFERA